MYVNHNFPNIAGVMNGHYIHTPGSMPMTPSPMLGSMYNQHHVNHHVNNAYPFGGPVLTPPGYGPVPFTNPFQNTHMASPTPRGSNFRGRGGRRGNNTYVYPMRDEATADREIAEQRANDAYEYNMGRADPPAHLQNHFNGQHMPRVTEVDESEQHPAVVNYSTYTNHHQNGNGAHGTNGYAINGDGAHDLRTNGYTPNGVGHDQY